MSKLCPCQFAGGELCVFPDCYTKEELMASIESANQRGVDLQARIEALETTITKNEGRFMELNITIGQQLATITEQAAQIKGLKHNAGVIRDSLEIAIEFCEASEPTPGE